MNFRLGKASLPGKAIMFDYGTEPHGDERRRSLVRLRGGFAVLLVLCGAFSLAFGATLLGWANLVCGISLGITELHRVLQERR